MTTDDTDAVLARLDATVRRMRERESLQYDRHSFARLCVKAVSAGDFAAAVDWAEEHALTCAAIDALNTTDANRGDA
ncbi:MAG TPA: hypothetical protein VK059_11440 [Nocardioidaceae bacterium]|nr:hypothetical protein [Nocardioidaceae bacterium]